MAEPTEAYAGSATIGATEHSLPANAAYASGSPQTAAGWYQPFLDLNTLAAGDVFEMRIYGKVQSTDTQRAIDIRRFSGIQGVPIGVIPTLGLIHGWDITLKKISGTDRAISWSIRKA